MSVLGEWGGKMWWVNGMRYVAIVGSRRPDACTTWMDLKSSAGERIQSFSYAGQPCPGDLLQNTETIVNNTVLYA